MPSNYFLANGGAEVDVSDDATGADWKSVARVLTTTGTDNRSGTVDAILQAEPNNTPASGTDAQRRRTVALLTAIARRLPRLFEASTGVTPDGDAIDKTQ
jgi:hypothetical protein